MLVTGGTGVLGEAVVRSLLEAGHAVTATWVVERERERIERDLGDVSGLTLVQADLSEPDGAREAVSATPGLGAVVNLVGGYAGGAKVHEAEVEVLDRMLALNLRTGFLLAREAMPRLVEAGGGAYVGVSARAAVRPFSGAAAYIAAKAAVLAFVQALHAEYRDDGVRCNVILPNVIDTPANRKAMPDADRSKWVAPAEIAKVIRFLISPDSDATSGAAIPVYGRGA